MSSLSLPQKRIYIGLIVALAVIALGAWYYAYRLTSRLEVSATDTSGAIFTVATSTGATYFTVTGDGKVGIGTTEPTTALEVNGVLRLTKKSSVPCSPPLEGAVAYNPDNKHFWGCDGSQWHRLDT